MKCPECGGAELVPGVKEVPFTYKGRTIMLETHADFCPVCGEGVLSDEEADRLDGLSEVFRRKVNEELFDPASMNCGADALNKFAQKSPASQPGFFLSF